MTEDYPSKNKSWNQTSLQPVDRIKMHLYGKLGCERNCSRASFAAQALLASCCLQQIILKSFFATEWTIIMMLHLISLERSNSCELSLCWLSRSWLTAGCLGFGGAPIPCLSLHIGHGLNKKMLETAFFVEYVDDCFGLDSTRHLLLKQFLAQTMCITYSRQYNLNFHFDLEFSTCRKRYVETKDI